MTASTDIVNRATAAEALLIELPRGFRAGDVLAFHARDAQQRSERVGPAHLQKGLTWRGRSACLTIAFDAGRASASLALDCAGVFDATDRMALDCMVRRMLGLTQRVDAFEQALASHPQLGPLIAARPGLRVPVSSTPFEALIWAVAAQQISLKAAVALRRRLIAAAGLVHSSGLACHPDAHAVAALDEPTLRAAGFSQSKAHAVLALAGAAVAGALPLDRWCAAMDGSAPPIDEIRERLSALRGVGPWTVDYALLRGFGFLDGSLHGDVAVRRRLQELLGASEPINQRQARQWLAAFSPWRALVAAHLWASGPVPPPPGTR